jgi:hypothetical protein
LAENGKLSSPRNAILRPQTGARIPRKSNPVEGVEMKKIRFASLVLGVALVLAAIAFTQIFVGSSNAENSSRSFQGMGDLHLAESQQFAIPLTGDHESGQSYTGMGDLNLYDARHIRVSAWGTSGYAGMGDLHLFESLR